MTLRTSKSIKYINATDLKNKTGAILDSVTNDTIHVIRRVKGKSNAVIIAEDFLNELLTIANNSKFIEAKAQIEDGVSRKFKFDVNGSRVYYWWNANIHKRDVLLRGIGKPEILKHEPYKGYYSRRVTKDNRIIYKPKIVDSEFYEI